MWWKDAVIYAILVPSFKDSNADGMGDLRGILSRLDYLVELNVDAIWLSPICDSPMFDVGYDVSDYLSVNPRFGTLDDYRTLLNEAHQRNLKVIIDFVPNHTSIQHRWFQDALRSRESRYRNYYLWQDAGPDGGAPNNWINRFGKSAWTWDERTEQYYFGTFAPEQPDLNWRNPQVAEEIFNPLRFWLDMGTDGVRIDALAHLIKDACLRFNPLNPDYTEEEDPSNRLWPAFSQNQPELLELIGNFKRVISQFPERVFAAEVFQPPEQLGAYLKAGADLLLNLSLFQGDFTTPALRLNIDRQEATTPLGSWPSRASGDHDIKRLATRIGSENLRAAAVLHFALRGTPIMYYGEELGLTNAEIARDKLQDPSGKDDPRYSRDPQRVPMPWNDSQYAGFSVVEPWLPIDNDTAALNVSSQSNDPLSLLNFYRRLLALRRSEPELRSGDYTPLDAPADVVAFRRHATNAKSNAGLLVALNLSDKELAWPFPNTQLSTLISSCCQCSVTDQPLATAKDFLKLQPREAVIVRIEPMSTSEAK